jgi:hypothetical protein
MRRSATLPAGNGTARLDDDFGYLVFRAYSVVTQSISHRSLQELNVTVAQGHVLHLVDRHGLWHAAQIARECGVDVYGALLADFSADEVVAFKRMLLRMLSA